MKEKILFFTRVMDIGGTENVVLSLCRYLKDDYDITVMSMPGANVYKLREMNIHFVAIDDICEMNVGQSNRFLRFLSKYLKGNKFSIIHTHHRKAAFYIRLISPKNTKLIHTMHNSFCDKKFLTRYTLSKFTTIACGTSVFDSLTKIYKLKNIYCIPNGIDNTFLYEEIGDITEYKKKGYFVYGFVGRICEQKGIDVLIQAFNQIKKNDKIVLFIYGKGDNSYLKLIMNDSIIFKGKTDNPLNVINQLDCLILPSRWEGLPLNILEAFSVKTLVICSNITNNTELVNESNGYIFNCNDIDDLYSKIIDIPTQNYDEKINNAYTIYKEKYDCLQFINEYKKIYENK